MDSMRGLNTEEFRGLMFMVATFFLCLALIWALNKDTPTNTTVEVHDTRPKVPVLKTNLVVVTNWVYSNKQ